MAPVTRAATRANQRGNRDSKNNEHTAAPAARKRKAESAPTESSPSSTTSRQKKPRSTGGEQSKGSDSKPLIINRAPVLELWGACVSHFLHPELQWTTCLSIGSAISSITAILKGRSIGTISEPDPGKQKQEKKGRADDDVDEEIKVMGFPIWLKNDRVIFKGKQKPGSEESLATRFGGKENLDRTRRVMDDALRDSWQGLESELDKRAFSLYEKFRPDVPKGQKGWGRKGTLDLAAVEREVRRN